MVPPVSLLDRVRQRIRLSHYSMRTEEDYCDCIRRFIIFGGRARQSARVGVDAVSNMELGVPSRRTPWVGKAAERLLPKGATDRNGSKAPFR